MSKHSCICVPVITWACFCSKQEEEQSSERRVPKCIKRQEATPAWVSDGQTHWPTAHTLIIITKSVSLAVCISFGQLCSEVHLSCRTSVAERHGRSSRVWRSSTAVPVVTREGSRSTKSSTSAGLSHASNYKHGQRECKRLSIMWTTLSVTARMCRRHSSWKDMRGCVLFGFHLQQVWEGVGILWDPELQALEVQSKEA